MNLSAFFGEYIDEAYLASRIAKDANRQATRMVQSVYLSNALGELDRMNRACWTEKQIAEAELNEYLGGMPEVELHISQFV
jgi:hypothetical protein